MELIFGEGKIGVMTFGNKDDDLEYGVMFTQHEEAHEIGEKDSSVVGLSLYHGDPILTMAFSKSKSVEVVIDALERVRHSLVMREIEQMSNQIGVDFIVSFEEEKDIESTMEDLITELNDLAKNGKPSYELLDYIEKTCTDEEREYVRYIHEQSAHNLEASVAIAASLL